jgi:hypothetical protein
MDRRSVTVEGRLAEKLPDALSHRLDGAGELERVDGDGFKMIAIERVQSRANSDLQATVILERDSPERWAGTVVAGGGGHGFLRWDWGTGSNQTDDLVGVLREVCEPLGLTLVAPER